MINTRRVKERRRLHFDSIQDLVDDVLQLDGTQVTTTGNWSAPQIVQHVAKLINFSIDGFPAKAPLMIRLAGRLMRNRSLAKTLPAGFRLPTKFTFLEPDADVEWDDAVTYLRETIGRLQNERMDAPSPVLGKMTHEEWERLHCRHAEMHFSFIHPTG
ncbi:MAG: DUF1569 domain-containing protein [Planctomycetota bacterium]|jgi:hypothetical protein